MPMAQLESIQHALRVCISLLEVLAAVRPPLDGGADDAAAVRRQLRARARRMQAMLIGMARALAYGVTGRLEARGKAVREAPEAAGPWAGYMSLNSRLEQEFALLRDALAADADKWNI